MSSDTKVSDQNLKDMAEEIGLQDAEIVEYRFQEGEKRKGFFIRSTTQRGLIADKATLIRTAVDVEVGKKLITWTKQNFVFSAGLNDTVVKAMTADAKTDTSDADTKKLVAQLKGLKVTYNAKEKTFAYAGDEAGKEKLWAA